MPSGEPVGGTRAQPYFFLSYAHTPKADPRDSDDPNIWVRKLYRDLCKDILQLTDAANAEAAGFMDHRIRSGHVWSERLGRALATCRVFVPLYSDRYFASDNCGKEWFAFSQRVRRLEARTNRRAELIIPVMWAKVRTEFPEAVRHIQHQHPQLGEGYAADGFYGIIKTSLAANEYSTAVFQLAQLIVEAAHQTYLEPAATADFNALPSAFGSRTSSAIATRSVRVTVMVPDTSAIPKSRISAGYYGDTPLDWNPYYPDCLVPLIEYTALIARDLGYRPELGQFEWPDDDLLSDSAGPHPSILLMDPWALLSPHLRDALTALDESSKFWIRVLVPLSLLDNHAVAADEELRKAIEKVLGKRIAYCRGVARAAVRGIPTLDAFSSHLVKLLTLAARDLFRTAAAYPPAPGGRPPTPRPRLRGPRVSPSAVEDHDA